jgi:IS5 family transposase
VISEVLRQQQWMYDQRSRRIDDRIVSISQPHVRPIKRGKAGAGTEFGAKVSISLVDGVSFVDRISWDNFNEGIDLIGQIESYRSRFGHYPKSVHADKIYRNRDNRKYCKKHNIDYPGQSLDVLQNLQKPMQVNLRLKSNKPEKTRLSAIWLKASSARVKEDTA